MSLRVELFPRAESDLKRQYAWYDQHAGTEVADRYLASFQCTVSKLALHPETGFLPRFRDPKLASLRQCIFARPFDKHLVFYRIDSEVLRVVRIIHGARDLPKRLTGPG